MKKFLQRKKEPTTLIGMIDRHLYIKGNTKNYKSDPRVRPSDVGAKCMRKVLYRYFDVDKDFPLRAKLLRIFNTGDAFHELVYEWLKDMGKVIDYRDENGEIPISKWTGKPDYEFPVSSEELEIKKGKVDGILNLNDKIWVLEIKSIKDSKFQELKKPLPEHIIQGMLYVFLMEEGLLDGKYYHIKELDGHAAIEGCIFLYINKNTSELKEFYIEKDPNYYKIIKMKIKKLQNYVKNKELPPKTEDYCFFCDFRDKCTREFNPQD